MSFERVEFRGVEVIAGELLECAFAWDPEAMIVGNVRAKEIVFMLVASGLFSTCPACGATAWVEIDCPVCNACGELERAWRDR